MARLRGSASPTVEAEEALNRNLAKLEQAGINIDAPQPGLMTRLGMGALDLLQRGQYASAGIAREVLGPEPTNLGQIVDAAIAGASGKEKLSYGKVFEELGVPEGPGFEMPFGLGKVTTRGVAGFAGDVLLDPTTYLTLGAGTAAKQIGKVGAKKVLTRMGEEALNDAAVRVTARIAKTAGGRASAEGLEAAGRKIAESSLLEKFGTKAGQGLFEPGGIGYKLPFLPKVTITSGDELAAFTRSLSKTARRIPVTGPIFGKAIDYAQRASDVAADIGGTVFKAGYQFIKPIKELVFHQKAAAKAMGLTEKQAIKAFPELAVLTKDELNWLSKSRRFAGVQARKYMVDMFSRVNPEEGKALAMAMEGLPGAYEKLTISGKHTYEGVKELLETVGEEGLELGFFQRLVKNFSPRFLTEESRQFLRENVGTTEPARAGLIKIFAPKKFQSRVLVDSETLSKIVDAAPTAAKKKSIAAKFTDNFFGEKLTQNTMEEINDIATKKLGFKWFEDDLSVALPKYYMNFVTNKALIDGLKDLPRTINAEAGIKVFQPYLDRIGILPGYEKFNIDVLKGFQAPRDIVNQVQQTWKIMTNDQQMMKFLKWYDKALSMWKLGVTIPWPAFHTQNFIGGQFNNFLAGITPGTPKWFKLMNATRSLLGDVSQNLSKVGMADPEFLGKKVGEGAIKDWNWGAVLREYQNKGVSGGFFRNEVGESAIRKTFTNAPLKETLAQKAAGVGETLGSVIEDFNRMPLFIDELIKHGDSRRAAKAVFKYQFDYSPEAYTWMENQVFRRFIPFYRFMRGNIPLQLDALYHQHAKIQAVVKAVNDMGGGEDKDKPAWLQKTFAIKLGPEAAKYWGKNPGDKVFMTMPFPFAELIRMDSRTLMSSITPLLRVPAEWMLNQEFFFGNQIYNPDLPPDAQTSRAYPILKPLVSMPIIGPAIANYINWKEVPMKDAVTGKPSGKVYYEADSKKLFLLKNAFGPISRMYTLIGSSPEEPYASNIVRALFPFRAVSVNPEEEYLKRLKKGSYQLQELLKYEKKRGGVPESKGLGRRKRSTRGLGGGATVGEEGQEYLQQYVEQ